ncbi:lysozyme inhibitor LprI family protein [Undibacterium sp. TJN19]|uniref:lysozyme inhibitor LprI family protein n=1 Tax=Undibacterium sp. TJN19 TaxID=3413055 RepID=UPI003BF3D93F
MSDPRVLWKAISARWIAAGAIAGFCMFDACAQDTCDTATQPQELMSCYQINFEKQQAELKRLLRKLQAVVAAADDSAGIDKKAVNGNLARAQTNWQRFIEQDCHAQFQFVGNGTARDGVELACLVRHYEQRIRELHQWAR